MFHANVSAVDEPRLTACPSSPKPLSQSGRLLSPVFQNDFFFLSFTQLLSPSLSLTLCLVAQAMWAIFTDSSHQPIWFPLPQTVTFIDTSFQVSGWRTRRMSSPHGQSQGSQGLPWQGC